MTVDGYSAKIEYVPDIDQFSGEILGLNGGADFYGVNSEELRRESKKSLDIFIGVCKENGIKPSKQFQLCSTLGRLPKFMKGLQWQLRLRVKASIPWSRRHSRRVSRRQLTANRPPEWTGHQLRQQCGCSLPLLQSGSRRDHQRARNNYSTNAAETNQRGPLM
jgi:hypothetical protein